MESIEALREAIRAERYDTLPPDVLRAETNRALDRLSAELEVAIRAHAHVLEQDGATLLAELTQARAEVGRLEGVIEKMRDERRAIYGRPE